MVLARHLPNSKCSPRYTNSNTSIGKTLKLKCTKRPSIQNRRLFYSWKFNFMWHSQLLGNRYCFSCFPNAFIVVKKSCWFSLYWSGILINQVFSFVSRCDHIVTQTENTELITITFAHYVYCFYSLKVENGALAMRPPRVPSTHPYYCTHVLNDC